MKHYTKSEKDLLEWYAQAYKLSDNNDHMNVRYTLKFLGVPEDDMNVVEEQINQRGEYDYEIDNW